MKTTTFLKKKNKIVKKVTGLTLVPKDQIVKTPRVNLLSYNEYAVQHLNSAICPYCMIYEGVDCTGCPMLKAGNKCGDPTKDSTWRNAQVIWLEKSTPKDWNKLVKLIRKYSDNI